jgi:hypothetical protein
MPSPAPNANGWNNTNVAVSFNGTDNLSGIASCSAPITLTTQGAGQTASGTCTDNAGNVSAPASAKVNIDKTPPAITITAPANGGVYLMNTPLTANYGCTDTLSGVASCTAPVNNAAAISTSAVGPFSFTVNAGDNAGNAAALTSAYKIQYAPAGTMCLGAPGHAILQPVNADGSSIFKQGQDGPRQVPSLRREWCLHRER